MQTHLARLLTTRGVTNTGEKDNTIVYADAYLLGKEGSPEYAIYSAVSDAAHSSGLTHSFSYEIVSAAVEVLSELETWGDTTKEDDEISNRVDGAVPIYNTELVTIYANNYHAVDEAMSEQGYNNDVFDSIKAAQIAWYYAIENMVHAIKINLEKIAV